MSKKIDRHLFGLAGKAISDYQLIQPGDRILIGVSGGKDSLFMAWILSDIKKRSPVKFSLEAATITLGEPWQFSEKDISRVGQFLAGLGIPYHVVPSNIARVVTGYETRKTPCSLCANLRRGYLHRFANELGIRKVALAHHIDDAIETLLMNMFYQGGLRCFKPKTYLSRRQIEVIRPLVYLEEHKIAETATNLGFPVISSTCGFSGTTSRQFMKDLIIELSQDIPGLRRQMRNVLQSIWLRPSPKHRY